MAKRVVALLRACHPGPCVVVTVVAVVLGAAVGYALPRLVLLGAVVLTGQLSIGWSNDWLDAARDRASGRTDKPVARGDASLPLVRNAAYVALLVSLVLGAVLGIPALIAHLVTVAAGWLYNLGMKSTPLSILPYLLAFGALPALATLGLPEPTFPAWWAVAAGALLGAAAHLANVLPDLDDDERTGVRGLPHRIGGRPSGVLAFACLAASALVIGLGPSFPPSPVLITAGSLGVLVAAVGIALSVRRRPTRLLMRLVMAMAVIDVAMLAIAGSSLTGA